MEYALPLPGEPHGTDLCVFLPRGNIIKGVYKKKDETQRAFRGRLEYIKDVDRDWMVTYFDLGIMNFRCFYWSTLLKINQEETD